MNFIKALEKAEALGVTKDEFRSVWEAELKLQPLKERSADMSQVSQNETSQDCASDKLAHQCQQGTDALKQALYSEFQALLDKHTEQQQQMWQEVHKMNTQKTEEYRHQFEILCQHVSNTVETQTSSLKLYFMHELDMMKQNLGKMIDDRFNKYEASALSSDGLQQLAKVDLNRESGNTHRNCSDKYNMTDSELLPRAGQMVRQERNEIQQEKQQEDSLPDVVYTWHAEALWGAPQSKDSVGNTSEDEENCDGATHNFPPRLNEKKGRRSNYVARTRTQESSPLDCQMDESIGMSSETSLNDTPIEATGFYAQAISDQLKRSHILSYSMNNLAADDDCGSISGGDRDGYSTSDGRDLASSQVFNYVHWRGFNIPDIATYGSSDTPFMSPFLHPGTESWKARLCISFGADRQLKVHVCITGRDSGKHHEWPIRITVNGFIFKMNSKRFTQVWALPWVMCSEPSAREVKFPAKICLATKRGSYPNVTYDELEQKGYFEKNKAAFKWNLKAEKLK